MRRIILKRTGGLFLIVLVGFGAACNQPAPNTTITTNVNSNANLASNAANISNSSISNSNTTANAATSQAIETKEPEQYQATVTLKVEVSGVQTVPVPPLKAEVAKNGADRRMEFALPNGDKLIYLDRDGKQFVISPTRKQYAELSKEATGIEPRKMLMPEEIVKQVKTVRGVERVGEEKYDGRDVVKYRYSATTDTQTAAGTVASESVILVDKETGLPLRSSTNSQTLNAQPQTIQGVNFITEMSNVKTTADAALFAEPTDMQKVAPEQIKQQISILTSAATAFITQMMKSAQTQQQ